jgi:predicted TIM-barrel fold metal-dependent hydrolase
MLKPQTSRTRLDRARPRVIDFHVHVGLKELWHPWVQDFQTATGSEFYKRYEELTDPDRFALYLESRGVAKAVILPEISPVTTGIVSNEYVFDFCRGRDVFLPFCTINPSLTRRPAAEFQKYIRLGAKGIKLYPSYNHFYPNDPALYPVYALAQENRLPVLVHTGSSVFRGAKMKYADPIHLDDVAADFPDLVLVMAHGGRGFWYDKAFFLSRIHPHLFVEISGLPPRNLLKYFPDMEKNIDKFIYGSDWPGVSTISGNIEAIRQLPLAETSITKILYGNAAGILRLESHPAGPARPGSKKPERTAL